MNRSFPHRRLMLELRQTHLAAALSSNKQEEVDLCSSVRME